MSQAWSIGRAVNELTAAFEAAGLDTPRLDARILVGHAVKLEPSLLFARGERILAGAEATLVRDFAARRLRHEPVSRITGQRGFWGLDFAITPDTLDPRPDTETIVSAVLGVKAQVPTPRILDLGTGSGCILLAILKDWPEATGIGIDISPGAVAAATANASHLGLADRARFQPGTWCGGLAERFDIIVSNPPFSVVKQIVKRLKELNKPWILLMPVQKLNTNYFREAFCEDGDDKLQLVFPYERVQFKKLEGGKEVITKTKCPFDCFYYCYDLNLPTSAMWLKKA